MIKGWLALRINGKIIFFCLFTQSGCPNNVLTSLSYPCDSTHEHIKASTHEDIKLSTHEYMNDEAKDTRIVACWWQLIVLLYVDI